MRVFPLDRDPYFSFLLFIHPPRAYRSRIFSSSSVGSRAGRSHELASSTRFPGLGALPVMDSFHYLTVRKSLTNPHQMGFEANQERDRISVGFIIYNINLNKYLIRIEYNIKDLSINA
jgi:hypothetical protein